MALKLFNVFFSPRDQKVLLTWVESHPPPTRKQRNCYDNFCDDYINLQKSCQRKCTNLIVFPNLKASFNFVRISATNIHKNTNANKEQMSAIFVDISTYILAYLNFIIYNKIHCRRAAGERCYFNIVISSNDTQQGMFGDRLDNVTSPCIIRYLLRLHLRGKGN